MTRFVPVYGTVISVNPQTSSQSDSCSVFISVMSDNMGEVNFIVDADTYVLDQHTFENGDSIIAIYDTNGPVPLIFPPQFHAVILAENDDDYEAMFDYFNQDLLNTDQTLMLNISDTDDIDILLPNGQIFVQNPGGHYLFVLYKYTTRSLPPITTPDEIIVFCP